MISQACKSCLLTAKLRMCFPPSGINRRTELHSLCLDLLFLKWMSFAIREIIAPTFPSTELLPPRLNTELTPATPSGAIGADRYFFSASRSFSKCLLFCSIRRASMNKASSSAICSGVRVNSDSTYFLRSISRSKRIKQTLKPLV